MKINLDKMDTYKFVVCVLVFVLIFTLIFTMQMKSLMNTQNKMLEKFFEKPKTTTTSPYTNTPTNKYDTSTKSQYQY